jgi:transposase
VTIDDIDISSTLEEVEKWLKEDKESSAAMKSIVSVLVIVVKLLINRLGLNSRNSSKPPSTDWGENKKDESEDKEQKDDKPTKKRKRGGQHGHVGKTLKQVEEPDDIESILVDRATLPKGDDEDGGIETRQVVDIEIIRHVTEYQAQVLMNKKTGERYVAPFPEGVTKAVQ